MTFSSRLRNLGNLAVISSTIAFRPGHRQAVAAALAFEQTSARIQSATGMTSAEVTAEVMRRFRLSYDPAVTATMQGAADSLEIDARAGRWPTNHEIP